LNVLNVVLKNEISWTDLVKNGEVLLRVKRDVNILNTIKGRREGRKANWIGHILRSNCLIKHLIQGKIERTRRQGRRHQQLLNGLKEKRRY
jgi:hypothetical protein